MKLKDLKLGYYQYYDAGDGSRHDHYTAYVRTQKNYTIFSNENNDKIFFDILADKEYNQTNWKYGNTVVKTTEDLLDLLPITVDIGKDYEINEILLLLSRKTLTILKKTKANQAKIAALIRKIIINEENKKHGTTLVHYYVEKVYWRDDGFDCYDYDIEETDSRDPSKIDSYNNLYIKFRFIDYINGEKNVGPYIYFGNKIDHITAISMLAEKKCSYPGTFIFKKPDRLILRNTNNAIPCLSNMTEDDALALDEAIKLFNSEPTINKTIIKDDKPA